MPLASCPVTQHPHQVQQDFCPRGSASFLLRPLQSFLQHRPRMQGAEARQGQGQSSGGTGTRGRPWVIPLTYALVALEFTCLFMRFSILPVSECPPQAVGPRRPPLAFPPSPARWQGSQGSPSQHCSWTTEGPVPLGPCPPQQLSQGSGCAGRGLGQLPPPGSAPPSLPGDLCPLVAAPVPAVLRPSFRSSGGPPPGRPPHTPAWHLEPRHPCLGSLPIPHILLHSISVSTARTGEWDFISLRS